MGQPSARLGDMVLQDAPHCHATIHPPAPTPAPAPHPALPLPIITGDFKTLIGGSAAARVTDKTKICSLIPCVPAGPGMIAKGSATVMISNMPAARMLDLSSHPSCVAPIPSPVGKIIPPCCPTVLIGG